MTGWIVFAVVIATCVAAILIGSYLTRITRKKP